MTQLELTNQAQGFDAAIDLIVKKLRDQIEVLHKASRETTRVDYKDNYKFGVTLYRTLVEELKKAKGNPAVQKFDQNELRAIVDHVTGECQSTNNATMSFFDTSFFPRYLAGELELKKFTEKSALVKEDEPVERGAGDDYPVIE